MSTGYFWNITVLATLLTHSKPAAAILQWHVQKEFKLPGRRVHSLSHLLSLYCFYSFRSKIKEIFRKYSHKRADPSLHSIRRKNKFALCIVKVRKDRMSYTSMGHWMWHLCQSKKGEDTVESWKTRVMFFSNEYCPSQVSFHNFRR